MYVYDCTYTASSQSLWSLIVSVPSGTTVTKLLCPYRCCRHHHQPKYGLAEYTFQIGLMGRYMIGMNPSSASTGRLKIKRSISSKVMSQTRQPSAMELLYAPCCMQYGIQNPEPSHKKSTALPGNLCSCLVHRHHESEAISKRTQELDSK